MPWSTFPGGFSAFFADLVDYSGIGLFSLQWFMVRLMRHLTDNIIGFREDPVDASRASHPSKRPDEIGVAERELAAMQNDVRTALCQKAHLAALGTAVAKVNQDLRGTLFSALLVSDWLEDSKDPAVKSITPRIISSIERAVSLCTETLSYVGKEQPYLMSLQVALAELVADVRDDLLPSGESDFELTNDVPVDLVIDADRDQFYRVIGNIARNAVEAGAWSLHVSVQWNGKGVHIDLRDVGPGLAPRALENLF